MADLSPSRARDTWHHWLVVVPEVLGAFAAGGLVLLTAILGGRLPERIPVHFDAAGRPDRWGGPSDFFLLTGIALALYGALWLLQWWQQYRFRRGCPGNLTNPARQGPLLLGMIRWLKAETILLFALLQWQVAKVAFGLAAGLSPLFAVAALVVTIGTTALFSFLIWRER